MREQPALNDEFIDAAKQEAGEGVTTDPLEDYVARGRTAWSESDTWFDTAIRLQMESATAMFNGRHPPGSKFNSPEYEKRMKIYRPKPRTAIRKIEAAGAVSLFSTSEHVNYAPANPANQLQKLSAEIHNLVVNYRLSDPVARWYVKCTGGIQEALTNGVVISMQKWVTELGEPIMQEMSYVDDAGQRITKQIAIDTFVKDTFEIELVPVERIRFSPASDWADPVRSSPYIIHEIPMFVGDLSTAMSKKNGAWKWRDQVTKEQLISASESNYDSVTRAREPQAADRYDTGASSPDYKTVWVQHHIHRINGIDYVWLSLRDNTIILTEPVKLDKVYKHGLRPYSFGWAFNEPHRLYKSGVPKLMEGLAEETNSLINARLENLYLALHKRYYVKRGASVDVRSLLRNVPGSVTMVSNINHDIREVNTPDVTQSSYQEQDRLNLEIDDLLGSFSGATVGSARNLNETVGGMNLMQDSAGQLAEYAVRTIAETWIRDVYYQLARLVAEYESDEEIIQLVSERFGFENSEEVIEAMRGKIQVSVNAGYAATSPNKRIEKLVMATNAALQFDKTGLLSKEINVYELASEVFGAVGIDAGRFFPGMKKTEESPEVQTLRQQLEALQGELAQALDQNQLKLQIEQTKGMYAERVAAIHEQVRLAISKGDQEMTATMAMLDKELKQAGMLIDKQYNDEEQRLERLALILNQRQKRREELAKAAPVDLFEDSGAGVIDRGRYGMVQRAQG